MTEELKTLKDLGLDGQEGLLKFNKCEYCGYEPVSIVDSFIHGTEQCKRFKK